ncbi:GNAT family N-acetyltransferase [Nocardia goodfellowii]|uniref:GNAT superfamily N-acetyltransferase n=1 Tax=Nocardia goodfellowii TaxID=882446 RepID=A0ABS4QDF0_9NOCA|nr:GNAT family N-acetyltransferase [Nocardia goodfellowii]MBP2189721.1 GNAT superfamily N-acetyltransferase [Nocardia goodfellowii]
MTALFVRADATSAAARVEALIELYGEVFAEPPYLEGPAEVARFRELLTAEMAEPGFELVCALDSGVLVGMAYGYTLAAGTWLPEAATPPPPGALEVPKFAVMELAVRESNRGHGLGRGLLETLLRGRAEPLAVLTVDPAAPADAMYRAWGWRAAGYTAPAHDDHRNYNILCFDQPVMTK